MSVIDTLVTEFKLKDNYTAQAQRITRSTKQAGGAIDDATKKSVPGFEASLSNLFPVLGRASKLFMDVSTVFRTLGMSASAATTTTTALSAVIAGALVVAITTAAGAMASLWSYFTPTLAAGASAVFLGISTPALKAAASIDYLRRSFTAMLGSSAAGNQAVKWIQQYGLTSGLEQGPLMEATRTMYMGGINPNRYLPVFETLAYGGGPNLSENMNDLTGVLRRLLGGQVGEAMGPIGLGRFGVNRGMLEQYGAKFDNQNQFLGTVQDALDVIERMTKYDPALRNMKKVFEDSDAVKWSNLMDAINYVLAGAGRIIADMFLPAIKNLGDTLVTLAKSGVIEQLVASVATLFGMKTDANVFSEALIQSIAVFKTLIDVTQALKDGVQNVVQAISKTLQLFFTHMTVVLGSLGIRLPKDVVQGLYLPGFTMGQKLGDNFSSIIETNAQALRNQLMMSQMSRDKNTQAPDPVRGLFERQNSHLAKIEENTRAQVELSRYALGGNEIGRSGVTPIELHRLRGGSGSSAQHLARVIDDMITDRAVDILNGYRRLNTI